MKVKGHFTFPNGASSTNIPKFQSDVILTADASEIVFENIPQTAFFLEFKYALRSTAVATSDTARLRMNDDSGANNYDRVRLLGDESAAPGAILANQGTEFIFPEVLGSTATANSFGAGHVVIAGYSDTSMNTTLSAYSGISETGTTAKVTVIGGTWTDTSAVTKISFFFASGNIAAGSRITMIGT